VTRYKEPTPENEQAWREWVASRPEAIRVVAERYDPWTLYRLKTTNQRVFLQSFFDPDPDGKVLCRVAVSGEFNMVTFERSVFGIDPNDLEECDLPGADEPVGSLDLPIEVLKDLHDRHPSNPPPEVMRDLILKYPLRASTGDDEDNAED
jgi:hypothetical protein